MMMMMMIMMICHLMAGAMMMMMMLVMISHLIAGSRTKGTRKRKPKTQTMQRVPRKRLKILEMWTNTLAKEGFHQE